MSKLPFDAVLFDCDGVLVDSELITNRVLSEMLGELGWRLSVEETMRIFIGKAVKDEAADRSQYRRAAYGGVARAVPGAAQCGARARAGRYRWSAFSRRNAAPGARWTHCSGLRRRPLQGRDATDEGRHDRLFQWPCF
ncbi:putative phosphatase YieH [Caballeronia sordidicola]|uniref:Putative phosphatase YieH n=1 Tax=Caballeronia sordidicola TaxID=196367 RepID=A0A242N9G3_CABSO|nr:putative phosphatase YieH [Caballeronia sordidicola]